MILAPICAARAPPCERNGLPEAISGVCPKFEKLPLVALALLGNELKLGWFNKLKTSKRSWMLILSEILVVLLMLKSHCLNPGPRKALRPQVPIVLGAGTENIASAFVMVALLGSLNW